MWWQLAIPINWKLMAFQFMGCMADGVAVTGYFNAVFDTSRRLAQLSRYITMGKGHSFVFI
jgi:hypothetical protein